MTLPQAIEMLPGLFSTICTVSPEGEDSRKALDVASHLIRQAESPSGRALGAALPKLLEDAFRKHPKASALAKPPTRPPRRLASALAWYPAQLPADAFGAAASAPVSQSMLSACLEILKEVRDNDWTRFNGARRFLQEQLAPGADGAASRLVQEARAASIPSPFLRLVVTSSPSSPPAALTLLRSSPVCSSRAICCTGHAPPARA